MRTLIALSATILIAASSLASISVTSPSFSYVEDFDSLASTGTSVSWVNDSTLPGWSLFRQPAPGTAITTYTTGNGSGNAGSFYSFGATGNNERALGGLGSAGAYFGNPGNGSAAGWIAVSLVNNSGSTLNSFSITYDGEQWRNGGNATAQTMVLEWGIGPSFDTVSSWTAPGSGFDFTSPVHTATAAAVDGNTTGKVSGIGGTINSVTWNNGDTLWIRWIENNDVGNDHGLAVDNFYFMIPEPSALTLVGLGVAGLVAFRRRNG